jgi:hypothetical protein
MLGPSRVPRMHGLTPFHRPDAIQLPSVQESLGLLNSPFCRVLAPGTNNFVRFQCRPKFPISAFAYRIPSRFQLFEVSCAERIEIPDNPTAGSAPITNRTCNGNPGRKKMINRKQKERNHERHGPDPKMER